MKNHFSTAKTSKRREFLKQSTLAAGLLACPNILRGGVQTPKRPNILFIINDQHNPRHMNWAGEADVQTPYIDQLAAESVRFTNAYTNSPICGPSRHCFYTGRYVAEHHVFKNDMAMNPNCRTLMAHLNEVGYMTANVGKMHNAPYHSRRDFQYVLNHEFYEIEAGISHYTPYARQQMQARGLKAGNWAKNDEGLPWGQVLESTAFVNDWRPDDLSAERWTADQCIEFMRQHQQTKPNQPFFLHASFFPPHHPYGPLKKYADMYAAEEMEFPPNFNEESWRKSTHPQGLSLEDFKRIKALYFAFITQFDDEMGRLLNGLDKLGLKEDTIVVFVSDHGDMMGEHGRLYKGTMHEASTRIPMLVRWPGMKPREESRLVSMVDFMPTFLAAGGIQPPQDLPGRDLRPLMENIHNWPQRAVYSETCAEFPYLFQMWRKGDYKLMVSHRRPRPVRYEFYNVRQDPYEMHDLINDPGQQVRIAEFKAELDRHYTELSKALPASMPEIPKRLRYKTTWPTDPFASVTPIQ